MRDYSSFFDGSEYFGALGIENLLTPTPPFQRTERSVTGIHVLSTKPHFAKNPLSPFEMRDTDKAVMRLSALAWKKYNGNIYLITDKEGEEFVKREGLDGCYDDVITVLDRLSYDIDYRKFWSAGKLLALSILKAPLAVIDLDMIIWQPLKLSDSRLYVTHKEPTEPEVYPPFEYFSTADYYSFPKEWQRTAQPLNCSFMYFGDDEFKDYYVKCSLDFMQAERSTPDNSVICACFSEQRILAECAEAFGVTASTLLDIEKILEPQTLLTHTWNAKNLISSEEEIKERFTKLVNKRLSELQ